MLSVKPSSQSVEDSAEIEVTGSFHVAGCHWRVVYCNWCDRRGDGNGGVFTILHSGGRHIYNAIGSWRIHPRCHYRTT